MSQLDKLNTKGSINQTDKSSKFLENTKKAVRDVLTKTWIAINTMLPTATTTTPTIIPANINTITPIASTTIKAIWLWTATSLFTACGGGEDSSDGLVNPIDTKDSIAPTIEINKNEIDITWWKEIKISGNQLYIWDILVASRSDNKSKNCKVELSLNWKSITSWTTISEEWTLTIKISDEAGNTKNANIKLNITAEQDISWLENIKNLNMQVDQEINILNWITFGNWAELIKTEIELEWEKTEISEPQHYTPEYPWECSIILSIKCKNWEINEYKVDNLTIKPLEYKTIEIINIKPEEILPIVWRDKIQTWDKDVYKHIEHLHIAECTKVRDMMREYGAGDHTPEEYQKLMNRLNTGMVWESPKWYNNYEIIWWSKQPSEHAHTLWHILNTVIDHANFKVANTSDGNRDFDDLLEFIKGHPNDINIFWCSTTPIIENKSDCFERWYTKDLFNSKNFILFSAWTNIKNTWWTIKNKIYNEEYEADEHWIYSLASLSNSDKNNQPNTHLFVTIATNKDGDIDQTWVTQESSKYPVWFKNNVLFSWRGFPQSRNGVIYWPSWRYTTSDTNYLNVAEADLCFQMFAKVEDGDQLLDMIKSTCLTDYIRFNWETQELQLINPAWFFKKYLMPNNLPNNLASDKTTSLNKWFYKWAIFDIPWAEVKINWQWVAYNDTNKSQIKNQNPMNLEWRLNGNLCRKLWYKWKNLQWKIIVVDDKRNGLNIDKEFSINIQ